MPLDDAFQAGTDAALTDLAQRPRAPQPQVPSFSMWGLMKAGPRGLAAGAAQGLGSTADVLGAFGQVMGAMGDEDWRMPDPVKARKDTEAARQRLQQQGGPDYNSELGRSFRNVGHDYMPDPVTAHAAEQAVANLFRVGGKAVAAGALLGPVAGGVVAGAEDGFSTSDDLARQGVDLSTRTKVGAVAGVATGVSLALPVAGATVKSTVGLALAGGPASFVAQQAATRKILESADYSRLAEQYDPFDPVGLTLSTVLPLGFGALAMRGARGAKAARAEEGVPAHAAEAGAPPEVAPAARVDAEAVDAARVNLLRENVEAHRLTPAEDLAGAAAHETAMTRAIDQMAAGERVEVTDSVSVAVAARAVEELAPRIKQAIDDAGLTAPRAEPVAPAPADDVTARAAPAESAPPSPAPSAGDGGAAPGRGKLVSESPELDRAVQAIEVDRPDMMVHLDGQDAPMRLADLMQRVREELSQDLAESPLIEAAANCFLRNGG